MIKNKGIIKVVKRFIIPLYHKSYLRVLLPQTAETYQPDCCTALYDAMGISLGALRKKVAEDDKVLVTVVTDGYENASKEYSGKAIKVLVDELKVKGWVFSEGLAAVMKDGKIGFINTENEVVIPFQFDYTDKCRIWDFSYLFHDGYCIMTNKDGDLGLIDTTGKWIVEPAYDEIWAPHKSSYRIIVDNSKHGVLDSRGNVIYPDEC